MLLDWLAGCLRDAGLETIPLEGWETRSRPTPLNRVDAVIWHHTATGPNWRDDNVARLLRDGRSDLAGPLSQLGLDRQGRYWVIAAGRCNHNGLGTWGNDSVGIEAFNDGTGEPWPGPQLDAYLRGTAAILKHAGLPVERVLGHYETTVGKNDPLGLPMDRMREMVAFDLAPPVAAQPVETAEELLMPAIAKNDDDARRAYVRDKVLTYWGKEPDDGQLGFLVAVLADRGADGLVQFVADSPEAAALRSRRGW